MFEKLLTLLLHGKSALLAGALVAGTAGVAISGTVNGVDFSLTAKPAASASPAANTAATPTPSPLTNGTVLSPSTPTNKTSTSGDSASNCSTAAHARNDAMTAARVVWTEGRAALALLVEAADKAKGEDKKDVESFRKAIDQARKDAQRAIQREWQSNVACAGKDHESGDDEDEDASTSTTTPTTTTVNAPASPTPTPTLSASTPTTSTSTSSASAEIAFDTSKLDTHYAKFIDDEVKAVNDVLSQAAAALASTDTSSKKDVVKKDHESRKHDAKSHGKKHESSTQRSDEEDDD
jgi:hypothetical protein